MLIWASQSAFLQVVSLTTLWGSCVLLVLGGWCPPWYLGPSFFGCFRCISHFSFLLCCLWSPLGRKPDQTVPPMKMHSMAAWQTLLRVSVDISCHEKRQREANMDVNNAGSHIQFRFIQYFSLASHKCVIVKWVFSLNIDDSNDQSRMSQISFH